MNLKGIIESAPESGFGVPWVKDRCKQHGIKATQAEILKAIEDLGYVKTRSWHKPRISTYNGSIK